ncbi:hypothetical protein EDB89DRAFT_1905857 [Lactarius sanguifluus]|nr:hypothetical protein EDB89DRAFT_1905857 [Lactarius sanguifluus]
MGLYSPFIGTKSDTKSVGEVFLNFAVTVTLVQVQNYQPWAAISCSFLCSASPEFVPGFTTNEFANTVTVVSTESEDCPLDGQATEAVKIPRQWQFGKLATHVSFATVTLLCSAVPRDPSSLNTNDTSPHPLSLAPAQIPREHAIPEFHFNSGKWDYNRWGHPGEPGVGSGAELWAWMGDRAAVQTSTDARWKVLQNSLSELFCASLGSMDVLHTTSPAHAFPPPAVPQVHSLSLAHRRRCARRAAQGLQRKVADWHGLGVHACWRSDRGVKTIPTATTARTTTTEDRDDLSDGNGEDDTTADGHNDRGVTAEAAAEERPLPTNPMPPPPTTTTIPVTTTTNTTVALGGGDDDRNEDSSDPGHSSGCPGPADADAALNHVVL